MWRSLASSNKQVTDQDELPTQSSEFKTFEQLYSLINGPVKVRILVKDQIMRIPTSIISQRVIEQKAKKQIYANLLAQESSFSTIDDV